MNRRSENACVNDFCKRKLMRLVSLKRKLLRRFKCRRNLTIFLYSLSNTRNKQTNNSFKIKGSLVPFCNYLSAQTEKCLSLASDPECLWWIWQCSHPDFQQTADGLVGCISTPIFVAEVWDKWSEVRTDDSSSSLQTLEAMSRQEEVWAWNIPGRRQRFELVSQLWSSLSADRCQTTFRLGVIGVWFLLRSQKHLKNSFTVCNVSNKINWISPLLGF